jgi:hypothetical protein
MNKNKSESNQVEHKFSNFYKRNKNNWNKENNPILSINIK